jgi:transcriptional regulator with XRE-family HTH domain
MDLTWLDIELDKPGIKKGDLARAMGIRSSAISEILHGDRQMKAEEIVKAAQFLGAQQPIEIADGWSLVPPGAADAQIPRVNSSVDPERALMVLGELLSILALLCVRPLPEERQKRLAEATLSKILNPPAPQKGQDQEQTVRALAQREFLQILKTPE